MPEILEQFRIADFLDWDRQKLLVLNPDFQRRSVWTPEARTYLVDTILRGFPIPKMYFRTKVDVKTKKSVREVVDGQQRLRAILDFADDKFALSKRADDFSGSTYTKLSEEVQQSFLSYPIAVGQLLNASDDEVLEVFARLNAYSLPLNAAEKRHAKYQSDFKWAVRDASRRWAALWDEFHVIGVRQRLRMADDSLMAEMFGVLLEGVCDGGQKKIDTLYKRYDAKFEQESRIVETLGRALDHFVKNFGESLVGTPVLGAPHFLMLFAALAHYIAGIPEGEMGQLMPRRNDFALSDLNVARANLLQLGAVIEAEEPPPRFQEFWTASKASTQRISSRRVRFPWYCEALLPQPI